jgi:peptidoglycan hydrolase-like protein with peptidoglycan-binding domain
MGRRTLRRVIAGSLGAASLAVLLTISAATASADEPNPTPSPTVTPSVAPAAPTVDFPLRPGDQGALIKVLHDRLEWLGYSIPGDEILDEAYGPSTQRALTALQKKFWLPIDRYVTRKSWDRIKGIAGPIGQLPKACTSKESICISTKQNLVRWVSDGKVAMSADARFGMPETATARGTFSVARKSRDHVSSLYRTAMPFALFFHGGQAVHYSAYFKRDGYYGASHGCVNLRDYAKAQQLFDNASVGTRVHVY